MLIFLALSSIGCTVIWFIQLESTSNAAEAAASAKSLQLVAANGRSSSSKEVRALPKLHEIKVSKLKKNFVELAKKD